MSFLSSVKNTVSHAASAAKGAVESTVDKATDAVKETVAEAQDVAEKVTTVADEVKTEALSRLQSVKRGGTGKLPWEDGGLLDDVKDTVDGVAEKVSDVIEEGGVLGNITGNASTLGGMFGGGRRL